METKATADEARTGTALYGLGIAATTIVSLAIASFGLMILVFVGMCYDPGPGARADACVTGGIVFTATCLGTLLIPVAFTIWAGRARNRGEVAARLLTCAAGYLVPLVAFAATS
jgi:hypothetical protein